MTFMLFRALEVAKCWRWSREEQLMLWRRNYLSCFSTYHFAPSHCG